MNALQEEHMLDRQKLETVLSRRFPGATMAQIAAAANAIMGLEDEWEEIAGPDDFGYYVSGRCVDTRALAQEAEAGSELRVWRRRSE